MGPDFKVEIELLPSSLGETQAAYRHQGHSLPAHLPLVDHTCPWPTTTAKKV